MKKNYVFITAIKSPTNELRSQAYKYSIQSWKPWCEANGCELRILDEPVSDVSVMKPNYFRYFCFDLLEGEDYDQICLVDADTIIHPECPNFFELSDRKFCAVHNDGDYDWIIRSIENYQYEFAELFRLDFKNIWKYFNSGFLIMNEDHREFIKYFMEFYESHRHTIIHAQNTYGTGTDQPLINLFAHWEGLDVKLLPYQFNMQDLSRKNVLDDRMLFTKIKGIYHFNAVQGGPEMVNYWMEKTFNYLQWKKNI